MKFLIDGQLPPALARYLQSDLGCEATHVNDLGLREASDVELWIYASENDLVVISRDEDFVSLALRRETTQLIWVRLGNCRRRTLLSLFSNAWPEIIRLLTANNRIIELR